MAAGAALPGLFFCFAAMVLLIVVSVSTPIWDSVYFLSAHLKGHEMTFGTFGYTGSNHVVGYYLNSTVVGFENSSIDNANYFRLTATMVLHPVAAGLAGLSVIFGICGAGYHRMGTIFMFFCSALATLITFVVFIIDMVLWGIVKDKINTDGPAGADAKYGNANWMVLGALVALILGFCSAGCGSFGRYSHRSDPYKV